MGVIKGKQIGKRPSREIVNYISVSTSIRARFDSFYCEIDSLVNVPLLLQASNQDAINELQFSRAFAQEAANRTARQVNNVSPFISAVTGIPLQTECPGRLFLKHVIGLHQNGSAVSHADPYSMSQNKTEYGLHDFYAYVYQCAQMVLKSNAFCSASSSVLGKIIESYLFSLFEFSSRLLHSRASGSAWSSW